MNPVDIILLVWLHFLSDFIFQTDKMAQNKSTSNYWLFVHSAIYSVLFLFFGLVFTVVNGIAHFATDYVTSRVTSKLWKEEKRHWFFVVIGLDQAIHLTTLVLTFSWLN